MTVRITIEELSFLITIYARTLFSHRKMLICAFVSGICCISVLLGAAFVFGPNNHYNNFTEDMYCQWVFDKPIDYAKLDRYLEDDIKNGIVSSVLVITKTQLEGEPVIVYGLSDDLFVVPNETIFGNCDEELDIQCYVDDSFIPDELAFSMRQLSVSINDIELQKIGRAFFLPYTFPFDLISRVDNNNNLFISCNQNVQPTLCIHEEEHVIDTLYRKVLIPLELMSEQHIEISAITMILNDSITKDERRVIENRYSIFNHNDFISPDLSEWSHLTHSMLKQTAKEMWIVEIIMFVCMINQLVFWEILMHRLHSVINRCCMLGGSKTIIILSVIAFLFMIAIMILCLTIPIYYCFLCFVGNTIHPEGQNIISIGVIWITGFVSYCLICASVKKRKYGE